MADTMIVLSTSNIDHGGCAVTAHRHG